MSLSIFVALLCASASTPTEKLDSWKRSMSTDTTVPVYAVGVYVRSAVTGFVVGSTSTGNDTRCPSDSASWLRFHTREPSTSLALRKRSISREMMIGDQAATLPDGVPVNSAMSSSLQSGSSHSAGGEPAGRPLRIGSALPDDGPGDRWTPGISRGRLRA